jgi:hypothetical protein
VCDRQVHALDPSQEDAAFADRSQINPAILEFSGSVPIECGGRTLPCVVIEQQSALYEHLKPIADTQDQFSGVLEVVKLGRQVMLDLIAENAPAGDVVAVRETAGNAKHLIIAQ